MLGNGADNSEPWHRNGRELSIKISSGPSDNLIKIADANYVSDRHRYFLSHVVSE